MGRVYIYKYLKDYLYIFFKTKFLLGLVLRRKKSKNKKNLYTTISEKIKLKLFGSVVEWRLYTTNNASVVCGG